MPDPLATTNAVLNGTATVLLIVGYWLIKARRETAHRNTMLAAFATSVVFLACYVIHHWNVGGSVPFTGVGPVRYLYFAILATHIPLAATVPVLAIQTIRLGLKNDRIRHKRWAKFTFPIWLYVSITGVLIYLMLYVLYPTVE
ncbi:MAG: DUF420 domain-containing protein [Pirellulales bacterium]